MPATTTIRRYPPLLAAAVLVACCAATVYAVRAQAPSPLPAGGGTDCMDALLNLTSCLTYVEAGSTTAAPDQGCCPSLAGLVDSNPVCLCDLLSGAAESYGFKIDEARALKLPSVCAVETPPPSTCIALGYHIPLQSPSPSPSEGTQVPGSAPSSMPANSSPGFGAADIVFGTVVACIVAALGMAQNAV